MDSTSVALYTHSHSQNGIYYPRRTTDMSFCNIMEYYFDFKPIRHRDMEKIFPYLKHENGRTTDFSYGGLLMWVDYFKYEYCIFRDTLFIKGVTDADSSTPVFSLPIGSLPLAESVALINHYCIQHGIRTEFSAVPGNALNDFKALKPSEIRPLDYRSDYLYDIEPMATFSGKRMSKKRNHVNKFLTENPNVEVVDITPYNISEVIAFMDVYERETGNNAMKQYESRLTRRILEFIADGDRHLEGIILKSDGMTTGFSIGDIKNDTLYVHIEKATRMLSGSYETVVQAFTSRMRNKYPQLLYVNREDDCGNEGLRKSKLSYHPIDMLKKYNIIF